MSRFQRGGGGGNRSFGEHRGGGRGRGGFNRGRGGGGDRSFNKFGNGGNRSFNDSGDSGNRSFGRGGGGRGRSPFRGNRGGGGQNQFSRSPGRGGGGQNRSFNGAGGRGGFFKKQNGFNGDSKGSKSFQQDTRKRKWDSDSEEDQIELVEKPKGILKTPNLDLSKSEKKKVKVDSADNHSFQAKTPSTPHPVKKGQTLTPHLKKPTIDFDDDDEEEDEEDSDDATAPKLTEMEFEDSDEEGEDDDLESYEDLSGEDDLSDLEEMEDSELAALGGAEDSGEEEVEDEEESESDEKEVSVKPKILSGKPVSLLDSGNDSGDEDDDEEIEFEDEEEEEESSEDEPTPKQKASTEKSDQSSGSKLSPTAIQLENKRKLEVYKNALYIVSPSEQLKERKHLNSIHPYLAALWKVGKGLMFVFDSQKSRSKAQQWFKAHTDPEYKKMEFVEAEKVKGLVEESAKGADPQKLHISHLPDRINKKHLHTLFPQADAHEMPQSGEAVVTFKSADAALKALEAMDQFKLFGLPVLVKFYRSTK